MNWYKIFYLFSIVDNLSTFFGWMCFIFTTISVVSWIVFIFYKANANGFFDDGQNGPTTEDNEDKQNLKIQRKWVWYSTIFFVVFWLCYIATPSKKDMLLIIAGGAVGEFVSNDKNAQQLPADITRFLRAEIIKATNDVTGVANPEIDKIKKMSKEEMEKLLIEQLGKTDSIANKLTK